MSGGFMFFNKMSMYLSSVLIATGQLCFSMAVSTNGFGPYTGITQSYKAAGVVPYARYNGKTYLLLGFAKVGASAGKWAQFGGGKDPIDNNNPLYTAAREGAEELSFMFDTDQNLNHLINIKNKYGHGCRLDKAGSFTYQTFLNTNGMYQKTSHAGYPIFFPRIIYDSLLPSSFLTRLQNYGKTLPFSWKETERIGWISVQDFVDALDDAFKKDPKHGEKHVYVTVTNGGASYTWHIWEGLAGKFKDSSVRQALRNL